MEGRKSKRRSARFSQPIAPYPPYTNVYGLQHARARLKSRIVNGVTMSVFVALASALGFVLGALILSAGVSNAFGAENCGPEIRETLYFARFELDGRKSIQIGRTGVEHGKPLTLAVIRQERHPGKSAPAARACDAVCEVRALEVVDSNTPAILQLSCRDTAIGAVPTPAMVLWAKSSPLAFPAVRFGSWVSGYRHAKLLVEVDAYSQPRPTSASRSRYIAKR